MPLVGSREGECSVIATGSALPGIVGLGGWGAGAATLESSLRELQVIKVPLQHFCGRNAFFLVRVSPKQDGKTKWSS